MQYFIWKLLVLVWYHFFQSARRLITTLITTGL